MGSTTVEDGFESQKSCPCAAEFLGAFSLQMSQLEMAEEVARRLPILARQKDKWETAEKLRRDFVTDFPPQKILDLKLDDYVIGKGPENRSFCYRIEREMIALGNILGSPALKFGVYYGRTKSEANRRYRYAKLWGKTYQKAFQAVKQAIVDLIAAADKRDFVAVSQNKLSPMFKGKILFLYHPDNYASIYSKTYLQHFIKKLDLKVGSEEESEMQRALMRYRAKWPRLRKQHPALYQCFLYDVFDNPKYAGGSAKQDRTLLRKTSQKVFAELEHRIGGTSLRLRLLEPVRMVSTDGWKVKLGDLGNGRPQLQIWLDRFAGYDVRKLNFCFYSNNKTKIQNLARHASHKLHRHRSVTTKDMKHVGYFSLAEKLRRDEANRPILEDWWGEYFYYGIYDLSFFTGEDSIDSNLCLRAAAFFESVARSLPAAKPETEEREVYAQVENRKIVASHLQRERSRLLATERKIQDEYLCQVCGLRYEDVYGDLGKEFAEAHHRVPLHLLKGSVKTSLKDLATVCANCHRMLHKMEGRRNDVEKLKTIVQQLKTK